jgi:tetratricopeptide (TPR) repeat protein
MKKLLIALACCVLCWMLISMISQKRAEELKNLRMADQPIRTNLLPSEDAGSIGCRSLPERARTVGIELDAATYEEFGDRWFMREEYRRAIDCYEESIRISPARWTAYGSRGRAWFELLIIERAVADFTEAMRLLSENNVVDRFWMSTFHHYRGMAWGFSQYRHRAMDDFNDAIRIDAENFNAFVSRGTHRLASGQHAEAIADFTAALRLNPRLAVAYRNRGVAYEEIGDLALALIDLRSALRIFPNDEDAQRAITRVEARIDVRHNQSR